MPPTSYALLKAIRSHQISSPTVAASLETGRPNACNQCHLDKTLDWTAENLQKWYGVPKPKLSKEEKTVAASVLWTLKGDAGQRALMAWSLGWEPGQGRLRFGLDGSLSGPVAGGSLRCREVYRLSLAPAAAGIWRLPIRLRGLSSAARPGPSQGPGNLASSRV